MLMKNIFPVLAIAVTVVGCAHPRDAFKCSAQANAAADYEGEPSYSFSTKNPADDIHDMLAEGFVLVGTIGPDSESYSNGKILEFMRERKLECGHGYELQEEGSAADGSVGFGTSYEAGGFARPLEFRSSPAPFGMAQTETRKRKVVRSMYAFFNELREPPKFGAIFRPLTGEDSKAVGTQEAVKVFVVVKGTPAWEAGVRDGDVVVAVNGKPFANAKDAMHEVESTKGAVQLKIRRGIVTMEKSVILK